MHCRTATAQSQPSAQAGPAGTGTGTGVATANTVRIGCAISAAGPAECRRVIEVRDDRSRTRHENCRQTALGVACCHASSLIFRVVPPLVPSCSRPACPAVPAANSAHPFRHTTLSGGTQQSREAANSLHPAPAGSLTLVTTRLCSPSSPLASSRLQAPPRTACLPLRSRHSS